MRRFGAKSVAGWALGLSLAACQAAQAQSPTLAEDLQHNSSVPPTEAAFGGERAFFPDTTGWMAGNAASCPRPAYRLPPMMGDFFSGYSGGARQSNELARALVAANNLDSPSPLPPLNQQLTITEPGLLAISQSSINSVQDLQALLRAGQPLPSATQLGTFNANATLTTAGTIAQVQSLLASTPGVGYDIIPLSRPPGVYQSAVNAVFQSTQPGGVTSYNPSASGALLEGGLDTLNGGENLDAFYYYSYIMRINVPTPSAGTGGVGRSRIAENGVARPQDRVFFNYGFFDRARLISGGNNVNRFTPGFEKAFAGGLASVQVRIPMACTVGNAIFQDGSTGTDNVQLGDLAIYLKQLLYESGGMGVTGGLGVICPTANGTSVNFANGGRLVQIDNNSYHLQPFLGGYYAPNPQFFSQGFAQLDFDANGNRVSLNSTGAGLQQAGRLNDASFLFLDWSIGYWLIHGANTPVLPISSFHADGQISQSNHQLSVAPTLELHYVRSLQNADVISAGPLQVGNYADNVETLTMLLGAQIAVGPNANIGLGYATALEGGRDKAFDGAFRLAFNRYFGPR